MHFCVGVVDHYMNWGRLRCDANLLPWVGFVSTRPTTYLVLNRIWQAFSTQEHSEPEKHSNHPEHSPNLLITTPSPTYQHSHGSTHHTRPQHKFNKVYSRLSCPGTHPQCQPHNRPPFPPSQSMPQQCSHIGSVRTPIIHRFLFTHGLQKATSFWMQKYDFWLCV